MDTKIFGVTLLIILLGAGFLDKVFPKADKDTIFKISIIIACAVGMVFVLF